MHTELGRSQVEVERCTLSSDVGGGAWRRVGKATVDVEVEEEGEEADEEAEEKRKRRASRGGREQL